MRRREASRRTADGQTAGNYVARTKRPRNRNSYRTFLHPCLSPRRPLTRSLLLSSSFVVPSGHQDPDVLLPVHLRTSVNHLSPPYPAPTVGRSSPRVHASGRPTVTLPGERRERQVGTEATYRLSHFCDTAREHTRCPETTERLLLVWRANGIKTARDVKENNTCNVGKSCFHPAHALP